MITTGRVPRAMLDARHLNESPRGWSRVHRWWATRGADVVARPLSVAIAPRSALEAALETRDAIMLAGRRASGVHGGGVIRASVVHGGGVIRARGCDVTPLVYHVRV